tara:strand:- start:1073 stop:2221 length:1149 start_codon:yes stop_codon:yes gene_type:complete
MNICLFSGSRSEYGINNKLLKILIKSKTLKSYFVVTGLSKNKKLGMTHKDIKLDKFKVSKKIHINIEKTNSNQISINFSKILKEMSSFFMRKNIDVLLVIGDRYETLSAVLAAYINRIPVAHIHGGEKTINSLDDNFRHSISKFANLHFVSHKDYKKRLIQLGESKKNIHIVGGLGAEIIKETVLIEKKDLENKLNLTFQDKILVVNFYPEAENFKKSVLNLRKILISLNSFIHNTLIFTFPTHEVGKNLFVKEINKFCKGKKNCHIFYNLGHKNFLSLLKISKVIIGNSSSGILEMPSFGNYTINIGERQKGRKFPNSVFSCKPNSIKLKKLINYTLNKEEKIGNQNIYYKQNTSKKIIEILKSTKLKELKKIKIFKDLNF